MEFDTDLLAKSGSESSTQLPSLPPVQIIDLDSILQHASQLSNNQNQDASETSEHESTLGGYIDKDTLEQIKTCHSKYNRWLIFSDLHVTPSTLSTCLQVLAFVHSTAMQHQAGILFLGDFWHIRGFIRVDCLCAVLGAMSNWQVPCIMIPGNHDQINWGGTEHALTPLKNAYRVYSDVKDVNERAKQYPGPLILSHPTKFMNALFVPHTRDKRTMQSILESAEAAESCALFVHADVKGASMNDLIKSQHGLAASVFPPGRCIYSGHFHKPHIVRTNGGSSIRYVGSPYQTSLSEAGQSKHLLLVDSQQGWACLDEISIDIGPRYHRVTSVSNLLNYDTELFVRSGDKLSVVMPQNELNEIRENATVSDLSAFDAKINELRDAGVTVEIRNSHAEPMEVNTGDLEGNSEPLDFEEMTPRATLEAYINNELGNAVLGERTATRLLNDGLTILTELDKELGHEDVPATSEKTSVMIELDSVSIAGFGSFRKEVSYPLSNRGVVLLRGTNKDFGSDR
jgi:DNA repair exonuclease SbcCD nuclease subunit